MPISVYIYKPKTNQREVERPWLSIRGVPLDGRDIAKIYMTSVLTEGFILCKVIVGFDFTITP